MKYWLYRNEHIFRQTDLQEEKNTANPDVFEEIREINRFPSAAWQPYEIFTFISLLKLEFPKFDKIKRSRHFTDAIYWIIENEL